MDSFGVSVWLREGIWFCDGIVGRKKIAREKIFAARKPSRCASRTGAGRPSCLPPGASFLVSAQGL